MSFITNSGMRNMQMGCIMGKNILEQELTTYFQWFHQHPELGYQEYETTAKIKNILELQGIELLDLPLETGVVARIKGKEDGPTIAIRSDIDALPILEESGLAYSSLNKGVMHACGHDFHTASVIGAAMLLKERKTELRGEVLFIFQPAEEGPGGANKILETGCLKEVSAFLGIHTLPMLPVGAVGVGDGAVMAAVDRFSVLIKGVGSHAADPHKSVDPIIVSSAIVNAVQTIVSRNMNPFSTGLVSITHIESGNTWNVIPETAFLEGTVRTLDPNERKLVYKRLKQIVEKTAEMYGAEVEFSWIPGPPAVINDEVLSELARDVAVKVGLQVKEAEKSMTGEDFSLYLEGSKGVFVRIGTGGKYPLHHPKFTADSEALAVAADYLAELAIATLLLQ